MKEVYVKIDRKNQKARFSGPGTYEARETLKTFGLARWNSSEKSWLVSEFSLSDDELLKRLPNAQIESDSSKGRAESSTSHTSALEPSSTPESSPSEGGTNFRKDACSVSQLAGKISLALQRIFPGEVLVYGTLSSVKRSGSRVFMDLADPQHPDRTLGCVIWSGESSLSKELNKSGFKLEENLQVMFRVEVSLNPKRGYVSLVVKGIVAEYTLAKLAAQREVTNKRLQEEGLFGANKDFPLPRVPKNLLVLTSKSGTTIHDFLEPLIDCQFGFNVHWMHVPVQGQEALKPLLKALKYAGQQNRRYDAVVLFRGGGSAADLQVFNEYEIAKAICQAKLPFLVAIGHQEDLSSAQDVAALEFGVPKEIGHHLSALIQELRREFSEISENIQNNSQSLLEQEKKKIETLAERFKVGVHNTLSDAELRLSHIVKFLPAKARDISKNLRVQFQASLNSLKDRGLYRTKTSERDLLIKKDLIIERSSRLCSNFKEQLRFINDFLNQASPEVQLKRGFALIETKDNLKVLTRAEQLKEKQEINLRFSDASILAKVLGKKEASPEER